MTTETAKYCCKVCAYYTDRKSNLDNHYKSERHITKASIATSITSIASVPVVAENTTKMALLEQENIHLKEQNAMLQEQLKVLQHLILNNSNQKVLQSLPQSLPQLEKEPFIIEQYLNEDCKDAVNTDDLSIKILSDNTLDNYVGIFNTSKDSAFVAGFTEMIVKTIKKLPQQMRPFQSNDIKRNKAFVKVEHTFIENDKHILQFVKQITDQIVAKFYKQFHKKYPNSGKSGDIYSDMANKILINVMDSGNEHYEQIARNIIMQCGINK